MRSDVAGQREREQCADDAARGAERPKRSARAEVADAARCSTTLATIAVGSTTSSDVASAACCETPATSVRNGTIMIPPPTPSSPAAPPVKNPNATSAAYSTTVHSKSSRIGDGAEEEPEDDLERPLVDAREQPGADPGPDDAPDRERDRVAELHLARDAVDEDAREADRDDRAERERVRVALAVAGPEDEQRDHDDAAADPEQAGEHADPPITAGCR